MRRFFQALPVLLLCLACNNGIASATATDPAAVESLMVMRVEGTLVVAPDGSVSKYEIGTAVDPGLRALLDRQVAAWRFEPVLVDGKAVFADTRWRATLAGVKEGGELAVHVDSVLFLPTGEATTPFPQSGAIDAQARRMNPPAYPREQMKMRLNARVMLALQFNPDGTVAQVAPMQSMLFDVRDNPKAMAKNLHMFELATVEAAKKWHADTTKGPLSGAALSTYTTVDFLTGEAGGKPPKELEVAGSWHQVGRLKHASQPWLDAKGARPGPTDIDPSDLVPLAGAVRLLTPLN